MLLSPALIPGSAFATYLLFDVTFTSRIELIPEMSNGSGLGCPSSGQTQFRLEPPAHLFDRDDALRQPREAECVPGEHVAEVVHAEVDPRKTDQQHPRRQADDQSEPPPPRFPPQRQ